MTKQTITSIIILILAIAGLVFLTYWKPASQVPLIPNMGNQQSEELISILPTMVDVSEDSYLLGISGSYPQFPQADSVFNKKIADAINAETSEFKKIASENYQAQLATGGDAFQKRFEQGEMYTLFWSTEVIQSNNNYISVLILQESYTGGAHGSHIARSFNYDVKNKKVIAITDLKSLDQISQQSRISLKQQFQEKEAWNDEIQDWIDEGTDPAKSENFKVFTMTPDVVTIYFNEYQVAPYVYGEQQVVIPIK